MDGPILVTGGPAPSAAHRWNDCEQPVDNFACSAATLGRADSSVT